MNTLSMLYFGLGLPTGDTVCRLAFDYFLADVVSPLFPYGFTVTEGFGQWRNRAGILVQEPARVLSIVWLDDRAEGAPFSEISARIDAIRNAYKGRFAQESVLRVDVDARGSF